MVGKTREPAEQVSNLRVMRVYGTQTALSASLRTFLVMVRQYDCEPVMLDLSHLTSERLKALPRPVGTWEPRFNRDEGNH